jgi:hypothetical protein
MDAYHSFMAMKLPDFNNPKVEELTQKCRRRELRVEIISDDGRSNERIMMDIACALVDHEIKNFTEAYDNIKDTFNPDRQPDARKNAYGHYMIVYYSGINQKESAKKAFYNRKLSEGKTKSENSKIKFGREPVVELKLIFHIGQEAQGRANKENWQAKVVAEKQAKAAAAKNAKVRKQDVVSSGEKNVRAYHFLEDLGSDTMQKTVPTKRAASIPSNNPTQLDGHDNLPKTKKIKLSTEQKADAHKSNAATDRSLCRQVRKCIQQQYRQVIQQAFLREASFRQCFLPNTSQASQRTKPQDQQLTYPWVTDEIRQCMLTHHTVGLYWSTAPVPAKNKNEAASHFLSVAKKYSPHYTHHDGRGWYFMFPHRNWLRKCHEIHFEKAGPAVRFLG